MTITSFQWVQITALGEAKSAGLPQVEKDLAKILRQPHRVADAFRLVKWKSAADFQLTLTRWQKMGMLEVVPKPATSAHLLSLALSDSQPEVVNVAPKEEPLKELLEREGESDLAALLEKEDGLVKEISPEDANDGMIAEMIEGLDLAKRGRENYWLNYVIPPSPKEVETSAEEDLALLTAMGLAGSKTPAKPSNSSEKIKEAPQKFSESSMSLEQLLTQDQPGSLQEDAKKEPFAISSPSAHHMPISGPSNHEAQFTLPAYTLKPSSEDSEQPEPTLPRVSQLDQEEPEPKEVKFANTEDLSPTEMEKKKRRLAHLEQLKLAAAQKEQTRAYQIKKRDEREAERLKQQEKVQAQKREEKMGGFQSWRERAERLKKLSKEDGSDS